MTERVCDDRSRACSVCENAHISRDYSIFRTHGALVYILPLKVGVRHWPLFAIVYFSKTAHINKLSVHNKTSLYFVMVYKHVQKENNFFDNFINLL